MGLSVTAGAQNLLPSVASPAPENPSFTLSERWQHYVYRTYSWQRLGLLAVDTGIDMTLSKPSCGRTLNCFQDRYAGAFIGRSTRTTIELLAGAVLQEDIRRRTSRDTQFSKRVKHALVHSFVAYTPDGHARPAYSRLLGAAGGIYTLSEWNCKPMTTGRMAHQLSWVLASNVQDSLLNEFSPDLKRFGLRVGNRLLPGLFH